MEEAQLPAELLDIVRSLSIAVDSDFMAREHAGQIWKGLLKVSGFDLPNNKNKRQQSGGD